MWLGWQNRYVSGVEIKAWMANQKGNLDLKYLVLPNFLVLSFIQSHHTRLFSKLNNLRNFVHCFVLKFIDSVADSVQLVAHSFIDTANTQWLGIPLQT